MSRHVGFVRNVMIGREGLHRPVLLAAVAAAGGEDPVSYISTGNVTFDLAAAKVASFQSDLEHRIATVIGRHEPVFIRTFAELAELYERNPFEPPPLPNTHERVVTFCAMPTADLLDLPFVTERGDLSIFAAAGCEVFSANRLVAGRTRAPGGIIERMLGTQVTTRAWSTIERIVAKNGR